VDPAGVSEMDGGRRVETNARMAVLLVVPPEEASTESAAIFKEYKQVGPMKIARSHREQTVSRVA
jgi:hypothetical protein